MKCEDLYNEILNTYDSEYIQKSMLTQCSSASDGNFFVINDNKKKVYFSLFFEATYKNDEKVYADFITVDNILMWQLKASEDKVDKEKITKIIMLILKGKHYGKAEKKYLSENMTPLFVGSNFEKMQKKYL